MTARIVQIGKRRWLAGMTWSSFEDVPNKAELAEDAERLNSSWVSVRKGDAAIQAGFCAPVEGVKSPAKLNSLAAMLADSREQPWLGIFKIEEGVWWYIAVRDGHAILPDGDVIGGEDEIFAARDRHSGYTDWNYIEGDIELLGEFIDEIDAKPTRITSLAGPAIPGAMLVIAAAVTLAAVCGVGYRWHQSQQLEEQQRLAAMAQMRAKLAGAKVPTAVASPLLTMPASNAWLAACNRGIADLPLSRKGWVPDQVGCNAQAIWVHWISKEGATVAERPEGAVSAQGDFVDQEIPLAGLEQRGEDDAVELSKAKLTLRAWAQSAGFTLTMMQTAPAPVLPGASAPATVAIPTQADFALELPISPFGLDLSALPGIRLSKIKSTDAGWHMEGTIYGR